MRKKSGYLLPILLLMFWVIPAVAEVYIQCPCYQLTNPITGQPDPNGKPDPTKYIAGAVYNPATQNVECTIGARKIACKAMTAGDGHVNMADGNDMFIFGFDDVTVKEGQCINHVCSGYKVGQPCQSLSDCTGGGMPVDQVMNMVNDDTVPGGMRGAEASAPTINLQAGWEFYVSLTNVGMIERPDLFDPHTIHYHGFPNAGSVFDGEPMASISVNMGESLTYYYSNVEPGTYMYHCHVEASEHMQLGMLGNLYVRPQQDGTDKLYQGRHYTHFAYNDGDGSTGYDVGYPMQITAFDPKFHHNDNSYNFVDFADMNDTYTLLNGRGYPDTIIPCGRQTAYPTQNYPACTQTMVDQLTNSLPANPAFPGSFLGGVVSQNVSALVTATQGQKILLHFPSLATSEFNTVTLLGLPMQVVGQGARQYKGPTGATYYLNTNSVTLGGGEAYDVLIDTSNANVPSGSSRTFFLYTTNLNYLSNTAQDFGGMMTEIVISN